MKKLVIGSVAGMLLACAPGPEGSAAARRSAASVELVPYSDFEGALWPEGERVVVLSAGHETREDKFVAYGVDVVGREVRYALYGDREEFAQFKERLALELFKASAPCRIDLGQVPTPLPPPVNPDGEPFGEVIRRAYLAAEDACPR